MPEVITLLRELRGRWTPKAEADLDSDKVLAQVTQQHGDEYLCAAFVKGVWIGFRLAPGEIRRWDVIETATLPPEGQRLKPEAIRNVPLGRLVIDAEDQIARLSAKSRTRRRRDQASSRSTDTRSASPLIGATEANLSAFLNDAPGVRIADVDYALLAFEYLQLAEGGSRSPAKYLSERFGHGSAPQWSNRLGEARRRGLLSKGERGLVGGHLTEKAEALLGP